MDEYDLKEHAAKVIAMLKLLEEDEGNALTENLVPGIRRYIETCEHYRQETNRR